MTIDWDNAPEGAEAAHPGSEGFYPAWYKRDVAGLVEQICPGAGVNHWTWMVGRRDFPNGHVLRPEKDKAPWTGEGLPPVGIDVEVLHSGHEDWTVQHINYIGGPKGIVVFRGKVDQEFACPVISCQFRPIRTPEQIAEEARQAAITVIEKRIMARMDDLNVRNLAEDLHVLLQEMAVKP